MDNQKNQVYVVSLKKYVDSGYITPKQYDDLVNSYRTKQKLRGECFIPKEEFYRCEGDCGGCKYHRPPFSLDTTCTSDEDGSVFTPGENVASSSLSPDEIAIDTVFFSEILKRVSELLPEALTVGKLTQQKVNLEDATYLASISRRTYSRRLDKIRKILQLEFPEYDFSKKKK